MAWTDSKSFISLAYKYSLGNGELNDIDYSKLKVYTTDSNFYKAYSAQFISDTNLRLSNLSASVVVDEENNSTISGTFNPTYLRLGDVLIDSINNETNLKSDSKQTYEHAKNSACSSVIFNNSACGSWIVDDLDYEPLYADQKEINNSEYFKSEYNFSTGYSSAEYRKYNVQEELLIENVIRLSGVNFEMVDDKQPECLNSMSAGAGGLLLTYDGGQFKNPENELPVAFFNFGKTLYSNKNYLKVDWNNTGIVNIL